MLLTDVRFGIVDLETTGLGGQKDAGNDRVVEMATVWMKLGEPLTWKHSLINPEMPIPPDSSAQHHIVDEDVADAPLLNVWLSDFQWNCDCSVAHNAVFDTKFVLFQDPVLCTRRLFRKMWPESAYSSNQFLRYFFGLKKIAELEQIGATHAHRALYDAIVTAKNLEHMLKLIIASSPTMDLQTLLDWTLQPTLLKYVEFGKYKGMEWSQVPRDYMDYASTNFKDLEPDVRFTINHYLKVV
jgi:exodeoxyribonuclease X